MFNRKDFGLQNMLLDRDNQVVYQTLKEIGLPRLARKVRFEDSEREDCKKYLPSLVKKCLIKGRHDLANAMVDFGVITKSELFMFVFSFEYKNK